ncbi:unnamed protein product [Ceutorhynchus assimilis]|uniref:Uncharacterized protein n=1 Tax=Ceutorhynchus assimilis TaxID=467358 RepID=A0A9N9N2E3_9CUCU|nr:unnamed protein product [Ceutorhynchus assimilis]
MASRPANNIIGRRGVLGDLGNTLHTLNHDPTANLKRNVLEPSRIGVHQKDAAKKTVTDLTKKIVPAASKENNLKINKENAAAVKIPCRKPIRQESLVYPKNKTLAAEKPINKTLIPTSTRNTSLVQPAKASLAQPKTNLLAIYDPDEKSKGDPLLVTEYVQDIMAHLRSLEDQFPIAEKFLEHSKVSPKMRTIVVNWLVDVHKNFSMGLETLYLSISILDRYLQVNQAVDRNILQLVGTSALLLAGKYEEVYIPDLTDFVYICDDAFTKKQILQMEMDICKKLGFRMGWPIATYFLRRYSKVANARHDHHNLAKYILEAALLEYHLAHVKPSIQAAAASCLALAIINEAMNPEKLWTPSLVHYSKYKYSDFKHIVHEFARMISKADTCKYDSVRLKYSTSKFGKVSLSCKLEGPLIRKLSSAK